MSVETPVDPDSHMWKSWLHYKKSEDYAATMHWAQYDQHRVGSAWAVYMRGYDDAQGEPGHWGACGVVFIAFTGAIVGFCAGAILW